MTLQTGQAERNGRERREAAARKMQGDTLLFPVQDLFSYLRVHSTLSGIQRVQAGIVLYAIEHEGDRVGILVNDKAHRLRNNQFLLVDNDLFTEAIVYASGERVDHAVLKMMLDWCETAAVTVEPQPPNSIMILGSFWGHNNTLNRFATARQAGVRIGALIYDVIPITYPEYCVSELTHDFTLAIGELPIIVDFVFTISDYTRHSLGRLLQRVGSRTIPMRTVPLAHAFTASQTSTDSWPDALQHLQDRPFVTYVSTVEGRKNHLYVVQAWREMIEAGLDVPDLVFVGRKGWRSGGLTDLVDGTRNLGGRLHIVHGLTDAELNAVYRRCLFTVFTSFVEGWGLPVSESLMHGVPCVASNTSSIPEVGGDFVDYVDPLNLRDGIAVFRRMIEDHDYREERKRHILADFVPRTWDDVGRDLLAGTREALLAVPDDRPLVPLLPAGRKFDVAGLENDIVDLASYAASPMRLTLLDNFYATEDFGAWMQGATGKLTFRTDLAPGTPILAYVGVQVPDRAVGRTLTVYLVQQGDSEENTRTILLNGPGTKLIRLAATVPEDGLCTIGLSVSGMAEPVEGDARAFLVGLRMVGHTARDDEAQRESLIEQLTFADLTASA